MRRLALLGVAVGILMGTAAMGMAEMPLPAVEKCRTLPADEFFVDDDNLHYEVGPRIYPRVDNSEAQGRIDEGIVVAHLFTPLCAQEQERVIEVLKELGYTDDEIQKMPAPLQENHARRRVRMPTPQSSRDALGVALLDPGEFRHSLQVTECYRRDSLCLKIAGQWEWLDVPRFALVDKWATAWSQHWNLIGAHKYNYWWDYACNLLGQCDWYEFRDNRFDRYELTEGVGYPIDIHKWVGTRDVVQILGNTEIKIYKRPVATLEPQTISILSRYYHKTVTFGGTLSFGDAPSIGISPSVGWIPSDDQVDSYDYEE